VTLPLLTGNDTFVFENHAQTLTNKALVAPSWSAGATGVGVLDIAGSGPGTNNWTCLRLRDGTTNGTNKCGAITTARKTNSNPDFLVFAGGDDGSNTIAYFGGGGWGLSEATQINFFTRTTYPGANADGGTQSFGIDRGTVYVGVAALTTSATSGHFWIPSCPGVPTGNPSAVYTNAAALLVDSTNKEFYFLNGTTWYQAGKYVRPYSATIESPTSSEKVVLGFTTVPLTVSAIRSVLPGGSSTPSVTFSIRYGTDVSGSGTEVVTSGITTTNTTTGTNTTSFNSASIAAGNFIWITTSAKSGTVPQLHVTVQF
jgi:hypothetical protein